MLRPASRLLSPALERANLFDFADQPRPLRVELLYLTVLTVQVFVRESYAVNGGQRVH
jgi:hypothetical protein